jgi:hypothetical protein
MPDKGGIELGQLLFDIAILLAFCSVVAYLVLSRG